MQSHVRRDNREERSGHSKHNRLFGVVARGAETGVSSESSGELFLVALLLVIIIHSVNETVQRPSEKTQFKAKQELSRSVDAIGSSMRPKENCFQTSGLATDVKWLSRAVHFHSGTASQAVTLQMQRALSFADGYPVKTSRRKTDDLQKCDRSEAGGKEKKRNDSPPGSQSPANCRCWGNAARVGSFASPPTDYLLTNHPTFYFHTYHPTTLTRNNKQQQSTQ